MAIDGSGGREAPHGAHHAAHDRPLSRSAERSWRTSATPRACTGWFLHPGYDGLGSGGAGAQRAPRGTSLGLNGVTCVFLD